MPRRRPLLRQVLRLSSVRNLRFKWVGTWSPKERKLRLFRIMWETEGAEPHPGRCWDLSHKLTFSVTRWLPRIALHKTYGGRFV